MKPMKWYPFLLLGTLVVAGPMMSRSGFGAEGASASAEIAGATPESPPSEVPDGKPASTGTETPVGGATAEDGGYELRAGDRVRYRIEEDPATGKEPLSVAVNSVGEASFPVSRDSDLRVTLRVRGQTLRQVKEQLRERLLADYYHRATVELALEEKVLTPGKVQFFGEMRGTVPLLPDFPPIYLSEQVLQMGVPDFADLRRVKIHRVDPTTQTPRVIEVDVRAILKGGERSKDVMLQDGDRVEVPQKWIR